MKLRYGDWYCKKTHLGEFKSNYFIFEVKETEDIYGSKIEDKSILINVIHQPVGLIDNHDIYMLHNSNGPSWIIKSLKIKEYYIDGILHSKQNYLNIMRKRKLKRIICIEKKY